LEGDEISISKTHTITFKTVLLLRNSLSDTRNACGCEEYDEYQPFRIDQRERQEAI
jgi:hypothetical protein